MVIPIAKPVVGTAEIDAVTKVLRSGKLSLGQVVEEFEAEFAQYIGSKHAIGVSSGTAALHLALLAHGIGKGDEVITSSFSFISTANAIIYTGAKPVFVDISEDDFNIDPKKIVDKISKRTKAILPVHLYGQAADMAKIMEIADDTNLLVVEDACQAHGATFCGKKVGSFGTGTFSFYPTKNMTTGEGGMITTDDSNIAKKTASLRNIGMERRYHHDYLGYNLRLTNISAAMGIEQLKKLDGFNSARQKNAEYLTKLIRKIDWIVAPTPHKERKHVYHQYTIRVAPSFHLSRDEVVSELNNKGIGTGVYYPIPIHLQKIYKDRGYAVSLPICERLAKEVISLPIHPSISKHDLDYIVEVLLDV